MQGSVRQLSGTGSPLIPVPLDNLSYIHDSCYRLGVYFCYYSLKEPCKWESSEFSLGLTGKVISRS